MGEATTRAFDPANCPAHGSQGNGPHDFRDARCGGFIYCNRCGHAITSPNVPPSGDTFEALARDAVQAVGEIVTAYYPSTATEEGDAEKLRERLAALA